MNCTKILSSSYMNTQDFMKNLKNRCRVQILCICCPGNKASIDNDSDDDTSQTISEKKSLLEKERFPKILLLSEPVVPK